MFEQYEIIWLTGQSGAGKTTIGQLISAEITKNSKRKTVLLDGDDIRTLFENHDYSMAGRRQNIVFVQKIAEFLLKNDIIPIICLVSPFKDLREQTKKRYKTLEVYIHCSETRGREHFHVNYYEKPTENYIDLDTTFNTVQKSYEILKTLLNQKL